MARKSLLAILLLALALPGRSPSAASPGLAPTDVHPALRATPQACSSFCLDNGDHCLFGTNQDNSIDAGLIYVNKRGVLKSGWDPSTSGQYARWIAKYGSVTIVHAGYQMAWAGMNEAGLMISTMALGETRNPPADERSPLVSSFWAQYQLDNHSTVEEVIASDSQVRIADTVDHYLVCDRRGDCATIEFLQGKMVYHTGESLPVKALTNSVYGQAVSDWQRGRHLSGGVMVHQVWPDTAAAKAGLKAGDWITAIDDLELDGADHFAQLSIALRSNYAVGDEVKLTVLHPGQQDAATVTLKLEAFTTSEGKEIPFLGHIALSSGGSLSRFATLAERLGSFEPADSVEAVAYAFDNLNAVANTSTAWSIVFDPANLRLHFHTNSNPQIRYLDFHSLDFSCNQPVVMLDIHADLSGDITDDLVLYSHQASLDHLLGFIEKYERVDLHPFLADALLRNLERFPCKEGNASAMEDAGVCLEGSSLLPPRVTGMAVAAFHRFWPLWSSLTLLSLAFVVWHLTRSQAVSWRTRWIWFLVVALLGPIALFAYLLSHRRRRMQKAAWHPE
jgi:penicillin V acylase-like amidase (Ntn superfamily)